MVQNVVDLGMSVAYHSPCNSSVQIDGAPLHNALQLGVGWWSSLVNFKCTLLRQGGAKAVVGTY